MKFAPLAAVAAAALVLTACAPDEADPADASGSPTPGPTAGVDIPEVVPFISIDEAFDAIEWVEGADGEGPTLTLPEPFDVEEAASRVVNEGDGEVLDENSIASLQYVVYTAADGAQVFSTYESGSTESITLAQASADPALSEALTGASVGTDFLYIVPGGGLGAQIMAITVSGVSSTRAQGEPVTPAPGLPEVTLDDTGAPSIDFSAAAEMPEELVVQTLIEGDGPVVEETQTLTVQYTGWVWDGEVFDSSWTRGAPSTFGLNQVIAGWTQGLTGQTVGSQVLLVIPPELGYGEAGSGEAIPPNATLVFVVDILQAQ